VEVTQLYSPSYTSSGTISADSLSAEIDYKNWRKVSLKPVIERAIYPMFENQIPKQIPISEQKETVNRPKISEDILKEIIKPDSKSTPFEGKDIVPLPEITLKKKKTLVLYAYFEQDLIRRDNLEFFLKYGVRKNDPDIDYIFIINGFKCTCEIPVRDCRNIKAIRRENTGWDFEAWRYGLLMKKESLQSYDYFAFLNSSVRGPFAPMYFDSFYWVEAYLSLINEKVKLAGASINCQVSPHVQSFVFVTDKVGFKLLKDKGIFEPVFERNVRDLIENREVGMSKIILENGYQITCMLSKYWNIDWTKPEAQSCNCLKNPTEGEEKPYSGMSLHPFENMFPKCKKGVHNLDEIEKYSNFMLRGYYE
jgi:hypothetical protein